MMGCACVSGERCGSAILNTVLRDSLTRWLFVEWWKGARQAKIWLRVFGDVWRAREKGYEAKISLAAWHVQGSKTKQVGTSVQFSSFQLLSRFQLFATPRITALQASLSITSSQSLLKLMPIESVMPSSHLILCPPPSPGTHYKAKKRDNALDEVGPDHMGPYRTWKEVWKLF